MSEYLITGLIAIFTIINLYGSRKRELSTEATELIALLKQKEELRETEIAGLRADAQARNETMAAVMKENEIMKTLLEGRDKATIEFQNAMLKGMGETHQALVSLNTNIKALIEHLPNQRPGPTMEA